MLWQNFHNIKKKFHNIETISNFKATKLKLPTHISFVASKSNNNASLRIICDEYFFVCFIFHKLPSNGI